MKNVYLFIVLVFSTILGYSQSPGFTLTFEDSATIAQYFYTDSLLDSTGIWQIGKPNKPLFDSAYASTNAVVTLLDSALPTNISASFIIKVSDSINTYDNAFLIFTHKFDFDSTKSGGMVQYSIDAGITWLLVSQRNQNYWVYYDPFCLGQQSWDIDSHPLYLGTQPQDTTSAGIPYFTGLDTVWSTDTIAFPQTIFPLKTNDLHPLWFKFTAFSDSNTAPSHAGWLIDNIVFKRQGFNCPGGINEINSAHLTIAPNPVENAFLISLTDQSNGEYTASLLDLTGRELIRQSFTGRELALHRNAIAAGSYIIRVVNTKTQDSFEKRVVFE